MALAPSGITVLKSAAGRLVFRSWLTDADGADIVDGTCVYGLDELQSDGTFKSYDFADNTFKSTALTTATASMTEATRNNGTVHTGIWAAALTTLTGFTVGGIYYLSMTPTPATGPGAAPVNRREPFQYGGAEGDTVVQTGDNYARLGAPVGVSIAADIARIINALCPVTGSVNDASSSTTVIDTNITAAAADCFKGQLCVFTSGADQYLYGTVKSNLTGANTKLTLVSALPSAPASGDTITLLIGMSKKLVDLLVNALGADNKVLISTDAQDVSGTLHVDAKTLNGASPNNYAGGDTAGTTTLLTRVPGTVQPQTGDSYARLGAPAGASIAADLAEIEGETDGIGTDTAGVTTLLSRIPGTVQAQTGDAYARLGAPVGASHSADVAAVKADTAAVKAKTDNLPASPAAVGSAMTLTTGERDAIAVDVLGLTDGVETGLPLQSAIRLLVAAAAGKINGATPTGGTIHLRDYNDTKNRITATTDANGNRLTITVDLS